MKPEVEEKWLMSLPTPSLFTVSRLICSLGNIFFLFVCSFCFFETGSHVAPAGLELTKVDQAGLELTGFCLHLFPKCNFYFYFFETTIFSIASDSQSS